MIKNLLKSPFIIWGIIIMLVLGLLIGNDINHNFLELYLGKLAQPSTRYSIIIIILFVDNLIFESLNHYIIIVRNTSIYHFLMKSTLNEILVIVSLLLIMNIPIGILCFSVFPLFLQSSFLCMLMTLLTLLLFTSIIRFINVWINNRVISVSIFLVLFVILEVLTENIGYVFFDHPVFDFNCIFTVPYQYSNFALIAIIMTTIIILLILLSSILMSRKDYMLKNNEDNK